MRSRIIWLATHEPTRQASTSRSLSACGAMASRGEVTRSQGWSLKFCDRLQFGRHLDHVAAGAAALAQAELIPQGGIKVLGLGRQRRHRLRVQRPIAELEMGRVDLLRFAPEDRVRRRPQPAAIDLPIEPGLAAVVVRRRPGHHHGHHGHVPAQRHRPHLPTARPAGPAPDSAAWPRTTHAAPLDRAPSPRPAHPRSPPPASHSSPPPRYPAATTSAPPPPAPTAPTATNATTATTPTTHRHPHRRLDTSPFDLRPRPHLPPVLVLGPRKRVAAARGLGVRAGGRGLSDVGRMVRRGSEVAGLQMEGGRGLPSVSLRVQRSNVQTPSCHCECNEAIPNVRKQRSRGLGIASALTWHSRVAGWAVSRLRVSAHEGWGLLRPYGPRNDRTESVTIRANPCPIPFLETKGRSCYDGRTPL